MNSILIIRTDSLGDVILSFPVISALRRKFSSTQIWFLGKNYTKDILECSPHLDGIILTDDISNRKKKMGVLVREIKEKEFDTAVVLYPELAIALAIFLAGIPRRIGTGYRWYSMLFNKRIYEHRKYCKKHEVEYNLGLLKPLNIDEKKVEFDIKIPEKDKDKIKKILKDKGISENDTLIIIHPGSRGSAIDFDPYKFTDLIDMISLKTDSKVIISGTKSEEMILNKINEKCQKKPITFDRELTLKELAALLKRANIFVSNSTGPLHLAVALDTEVIGIFPDIIPLSPERWGPYKKEDSIVTPNIPVGVKKNKKSYIKNRFMDLIKPEDIFKLVERKISNLK